MIVLSAGSKCAHACADLQVVPFTASSWPEWLTWVALPEVFVMTVDSAVTVTVPSMQSLAHLTLSVPQGQVAGNNVIWPGTL